MEASTKKALVIVAATIGTGAALAVVVMMLQKNSATNSQAPNLDAAAGNVGATSNKTSNMGSTGDQTSRLRPEPTSTKTGGNKSLQGTSSTRSTPPTQQPQMSRAGGGESPGLLTSFLNLWGANSNNDDTSLWGSN